MRFTRKATGELALLGLDEDDAREVLGDLAEDDLVTRLVSRRRGEWMYVFKPCVTGVVVCVKLILSRNCVVVSFQEDEEDHEEPC